MKKSILTGIMIFSFLGISTSESMNIDHVYQYIREDCANRQFERAQRMIDSFYNPDSSLKDEYKDISDYYKEGLVAHYAECLKSRIIDKGFAIQVLRRVISLYTMTKSDGLPLITDLGYFYLCRVNKYILECSDLTNNLHITKRFFGRLFNLKTGEETEELNRWVSRSEAQYQRVFKAEMRRLLTMVLYYTGEFRNAIILGKSFFDDEGKGTQALKDIDFCQNADINNFPAALLRYAVGMSYAKFAPTQELIDSTLNHLSEATDQDAIDDSYISAIFKLQEAGCGCSGKESLTIARKILNYFMTDVTFFDSMDLDIYKEIKEVLGISYAQSAVQVQAASLSPSSSSVSEDPAEKYILIKDAYIRGYSGRVQALGNNFFEEDGEEKAVMSMFDIDKQAILSYRCATSEMKLIPDLNIQQTPEEQRIRLKNLLGVFRTRDGKFSPAYYTNLMWLPRQANIVEYLSRCCYYEEDDKETIRLLDMLVNSSADGFTASLTELGQEYMQFFRDNETGLKKADMQVRFAGALFNIMQKQNALSKKVLIPLAYRIISLSREYFSSFDLRYDIKDLIPDKTNRAFLTYAYGLCHEIIGRHEDSVGIMRRLKESPLFIKLDVPSQKYVDDFLSTEGIDDQSSRDQLIQMSIVNYIQNSLPICFAETTMPSVKNTARVRQNPVKSADSKTEAHEIPNPNYKSTPSVSVPSQKGRVLVAPVNIRYQTMKPDDSGAMSSEN